MEEGLQEGLQEEKSGDITACTVFLVFISVVEWNCRKISILDADNVGDAWMERQVVATSTSCIGGVSLRTSIVLGQPNHPSEKRP